MVGRDGTVLEINLSTKEVKPLKIGADEWHNYLGGSGLAAKIFYDRSYHEIDPLDEKAPLLILTGLLTGFRVPTACKASFCALSPATGVWAEATVGGNWPAVLRTCGVDGLIITGRSKKPSYLRLDTEGVQFEDATQLWGEDIYATSEKLENILGEDIRVAAIGPAGEKGSLISSIMIDGHDARAAGRCGLGAILGAKNLKAIVVSKGDKLPELSNPEGLAEARKLITPGIREKAKGLTDFGTAGGVPVVEKLGDLPIKNWTMGSWTEGAAKTSGIAMAEEYRVKHYACFGCPIRCGKDMKVTVGPHKDSVAHGPEYETAAGFGALCLNEDPAYIIAANDLCNRLGIDTISTAAVVAFAIELYETGLIDDNTAGGLKLNWGNGEAIIELVRQIGNVEGLGAILSRGSRQAAKHFGPPAEEYIIETKGLEMAFHDPRAFTSMAVAYATGNRGACHLEGLTYFVENRAFPGSLIGLQDDFEHHGTESKALLAKTMQDLMNTFNALGLCKFLIRGHVTPANIAEWVSLATGWEFSNDDLFEAGERLFNIKRLINNRLGISRKDDTLSPRLMTHDRKEGVAAGSLPHLGKMLAEYYELRGWSEEGIPKVEILEKLGLN